MASSRAQLFVAKLPWTVCRGMIPDFYFSYKKSTSNTLSEKSREAVKGLKVSSCETRGGDRQIVYRPQWCEICTWLIKILGLSMFSSSFIPFSLSSLPHFHMEGILGDAEQILPDLFTSSYFTRSTPIDELFFGRTTSENVSHDNSA